MKEIWEKYKIWIILAAVIGGSGLVYLVYYLITTSAKKQGVQAGVSSVLANIPAPSVGDDWTQEELMAIRAYANWLKGEFHWYSIHNSTQWSNLSTDTDRVVKGTWEQYALDNDGADLYNDITATTFVDPLTWSSVGKVQDRLKTLLGR